MLQIGRVGPVPCIFSISCRDPALDSSDTSFCPVEGCTQGLGRRPTGRTGNIRLRGDTVTLRLPVTDDANQTASRNRPKALEGNSNIHETGKASIDACKGAVDDGLMTAPAAFSAYFFWQLLLVFVR
jgi:hypothetical protein